MSRPTLALLGAVAMLVLAGCGAVQVKPSASAGGGPASRGRIDAPASHKPDHVKCLRAAGLSVQSLSPTTLEVAGNVRVVFTPTPGSAQDFQIENREQGAEVIGSALLYPGQATDAELGTIENCLAAGVKG